jgi:hypothetical protein
MAAPTGIRIDGLPEFRRALKAIGPDWPKELRKVHRRIAVEGVARSRAAAGAMGGQQARFAGGISARATQTKASVGVLGGGKNPGAKGAFFGAKRRTGWYARQRYLDTAGAAQFLPWVGNTWAAAVPGQGPYAINPALAAYIPQIVEEYGEMIDDLTRRAFPEGWH